MSDFTVELNEKSSRTNRVITHIHPSSKNSVYDVYLSTVLPHDDVNLNENYEGINDGIYK